MPFEKEQKQIDNFIKEKTTDSLSKAIEIYVQCLRNWKPAQSAIDETFNLALLDIVKGDTKLIKYVVNVGGKFFSGGKSHEEILTLMERKGYPANVSNIKDGGNIVFKGVDDKNGTIQLYIDAGSTVVGSNRKERAKAIIKELKKFIPPTLRSVFVFTFLDNDGAARKVEA